MAHLRIVGLSGCLSVLDPLYGVVYNLVFKVGFEWSDCTHVEISAYTHRGLVRATNEDALLVVPPWREPALSAHCSLFAVADGMGGHAAGEVASGLAVDAARIWLGRFSAMNSITEDQVRDLFAEANLAVWKKAQEDPKLSGMGTTLTVLLVCGSHGFIGHVGDSRLYRFRNGVMEQLTNDHTLVAEQVRMGNLSPEDARKHPARHILSRALGSREFITIDVYSVDLTPHDTFLLCSDGVCGQVTDEDMLEKIRSGPFPGVAKILVDAANLAGGKDNSTCVVVEFDAVPVPVVGRYSMARLLGLLKSWGTPCS